VNQVRFESLESARSTWEALAERAANPFATYEFASTWWDHFGDGRPLRLETIDDADGTPLALLPLFVAEDGHRPTMRLIGHVEADLLGPVCDPGDRLAALGAMSGALGPGPVRLVADNVAAGTAAALGGSVESTMPSPVQALPPGGWEAVLASLSATHRSEVRAGERRLVRRWSVDIREADAETFERDFATLIRLHTTRLGAQSGVYKGIRGEFHAAFAVIAARRGWARLRLLEIDGVAVAANYALRYAGDEWSWQSGRDPEWASASVGSVLFAHCVRAAAEDGVRTFRWLRGGESYKLRWATGDEPVETVVLELP
jgi:CelD/BcsL family acetyltransferase involved in cellulose biosynthesis